ncbi:MAG: three-Cys-motif partner protein TcmP [Gemmataceae bacterium]
MITAYQQQVKEKPKIAYIDLFAGPGRYKDGSKSTPIMILEKAIEDDVLRDALVTLFNDKDEESVSSLKAAIKSLPAVKRLKYPPDVECNEVGEEIVKEFESWKLIPTLMFVDPWGYKGLSLRLINSVLKHWACECIFFFNYNRVSMGIANKAVREHMDALFGEDQAARIEERLDGMKPARRELTIVEELTKALLDLGGRYVLPFCFKNEEGSRTTHHLIFVSKHFRGYEIMKNVMAKESSYDDQGVASFMYNPAEAIDRATQPTLWGYSRPLGDLEDMLLQEFAGKTLTMREIYERHNVGTPYIAKNYKDVLLKLELAGKVKAVKPHTERRKGTFADGTTVTFPSPRAKKKT